MSSFINFESGSAKEKARQELREAREQLLAQAEKRFHQRQEKEAQRALRGDDDWMLPSVARKLEKNASALLSADADAGTSKKSKKDKKSKKVKKEKKSKSKKRKKHHSSSDSNSNSTSIDSEEQEEQRMKRKWIRHQKRKEKRRKPWSSSDSDSEADEWVESKPQSENAAAKETTSQPQQRDDWMSGILIPTFSKPVQEKKRDDRNTIDTYDPAKSSRELNPFWKNGGGGLPSASFQKPTEDSDEDDDNNGRATDHHRRSRYDASTSSSASRGNWRKTKPDTDDRRQKAPRECDRHDHDSSTDGPSRSPSPPSAPKVAVTTDDSTKKSAQSARDFLTDQQMNDLGAKVLKAEIMGNTELAVTLRARLDAARAQRDVRKTEMIAEAKARATGSSSASARNDSSAPEDVLLLTTGSRRLSKPLQKRTTTAAPAPDPWGGRSAAKKSKKRVETHADGERMRFFADDDKYDIKQMFENEKFSSGHDQDAQFAEMIGRHKNPNDDLEDIFAERSARAGPSDAQQEQRDRQRAIREHQEQTKRLDACDKCFGTPKMDKQLIVAMGTNVYLALPWHEGLLPGHCVIVPVPHVACGTQLDEDVWTEVQDFQKAVTSMFRARGHDVVFFETARNLHRKPHMHINCVPHRDFELAPFYFKKAIQESEREWSTNKQLVTLRERDLRRSIPRGLPYFWVHFGTDSGFAHVIEEQDRFPSNFAQEIIGGMLQLDARKWRHQRKEPNPKARVQQVAEWWRPFDITHSE